MKTTDQMLFLLPFHPQSDVNFPRASTHKEPGYKSKQHCICYFIVFVCSFVYEFTHPSINLSTYSPILILRVSGDIVLSIFLPGLSWSVCMRTHQSTYISFSSTLSSSSLSEEC